METKTRVSMPEQAASKRNKNFKEVNLGLTEKLAIKEANRCLQCKVPQCEKGCPVNVPIKEFIALIKEKKINKAIEKIKEKNLLPGICGRVCPQENQCEKKCVLGIKSEPVAIGHLERFAADNEKEKPISTIKKNNKKIAIVGSGPAGLTCAAELAKKGYSVTVFEALHKAGGVLTYGIPEFRLPKKIVQKEIDFIKKLGVEIRLNSLIGSLYTLEELRKGFDAVFIGTGAGVPSFLNIPGEDLIGVYSANEFLTRVNLMKAYNAEYDTPVKKGKKVIVIGGGNVAMDAARSALRLGGNVTVMYRRTEKEMPARIEEVKHAKEEGIEFMFLSSPIEILGEKKIEKIKYIKMKLGEEDSSGRKRPVPIKNSESELDCDELIVAIGTIPNPVLQRKTKELNFGEKGQIIVNDSGKTNLDGVYAGGDIVSGSATVINAMGDGKKAAEEIDNYIK
ncbi:NADPH-dependent glutamate synthase [Candidatus Woesearchaeota archaeon]|nr:NADPH-dependent glutamate synthase [Candidatus Woesearchaeota archaeon]